MKSQKPSSITDRYWASVDTDELAEVLRGKAIAFRERLDEQGHVDIWRRSERTYYGLDGEGGWANSTAVTYGGEDGELVLCRINHFRSIAQAIIAMASGQRPAFVARAMNSDASSLGQSELVEGVVDWAYRDKHIEEKRLSQIESAVITGEGYLHLRWDVFAGRVVSQQERPVYGEDGQPVIDMIEVEEEELEEAWDPVSGEVTLMPTKRVARVEQPKMEAFPVREGDIAPEVLGPLQVVRDLTSDTRRWVMVPHDENVWDLCARYPQHRVELLAQRHQDRWPKRVWNEGTFETPDEDDDTVSVWCFYHLPTDALPHGRYALVCGECVLHDEPWSFPKAELPVYDLVPSKQMGTVQGYAPIWDLLCLQELYDAIFTSIASAHDSLGMQNVIAPKGSDIDSEMISRGLQLLEYDPMPELPNSGKPEALQLLAIPRDSYQLIDIIQKVIETLSGVNSVMRGDPSSNLKSGAALALVQSLGVQFNSQLQAATTRCDERVGTGILKLYQQFAATKRVAEIVGSDNKTALREFTSDALKGVERVTVEMGNPILRQRGGLLEIANMMLDKGQFKSRDEYFTFLQTGRIEPLFDDELDEMALIRRENEELLAGRAVPVSPYDRDDVHIKRHSRAADDPAVRRNPQALGVLMDHVEEHMMALDQKPIEVMWAIGQELPPWRQPGAEGPPPGGPGGPPPPGGPDGGPEGPADGRAQPMGGPPPPGMEGEMPMMPKNPMTGERAPA